MGLWPFGKDEEDENAAPNTAILEVPGERKYGMTFPGEYIRVRFNENGDVAAREKVSQEEAFKMINDGEAFMADERQIHRVRQGDKTISEIYQESLQKDMEDEAEQEPGQESEGWIDKKRKESPIGARSQRSRIDRAEEEAVSGGGGGNY